MEPDPNRLVGDRSSQVALPAEPRPHYDRATILDDDGTTTVRIPVDPSSIGSLAFIATDGTILEPSSTTVTTERSIAVVALELPGEANRAGTIRAILEDPGSGT